MKNCFFKLYWFQLFLLLFALGQYAVGQQKTNASSWYAFSSDNKECIVKNSGLPTPWLNRLGNDVFFTWVTHNGYIESFLLDPVQNGLTNPQKTSGRFYLREKKTGDYFEINQPVSGGQWESHIGLGYNKIVNKARGLESSITYFVPRSDDVLLMMVEINNLSQENKSLDIFGEVEWNLGDPVKSIIYRGDGRGGSQFNLYKKAWMDHNIIKAQQLNWKSTANCSPWPYTGFFSVNEPVESYETIKENFLGTNMDYDHPEAVEKRTCTKTDFWSRAQYPLGVLQNAVELKPGEKKTFVYVLGMTRDEDQVHEIVQKYYTAESANKMLNELKTFYDRLIESGVKIETPDKDNDRLINIWLKYQWRQIWKKSLNDGAYGLGLWSYGLEGESISVHPEQFLMPLDTELLKSGLVDLLKNEVSDTSATWLFGSSHSMLYKDLGISKGVDQYFKGRFKVVHHHQIWGFLFPIYFYLLESGDMNFLDKQLPFLDGTTGTVWEHIRRAMTITIHSIDERGFPRIPAGVGDWMDEFTKISKNDSAESEMMAGEIAYLLKGFSAIAEQYKKPDDNAQWMGAYEKIRKGVNDYAWDGQWYIRAFSDRARPLIPVGTDAEKDGKIFINAQSWSILSGIAPHDRAITSMESVKKFCLSDYGPVIFFPSYTKYVDYIGTQSIYSPGFRNGCIYLRPAGWAIIAACMNNQSELANEIYDKASLAARARDIEKFHCEPYVYPENYDGPDHLLRGQGEFQWCFGEATAWMWASYVEYILGVRAELNGLMIDPEIPASWSGFKIKKVFRGNTYNIEVKNPDHVSNGVKSITINGKSIKGHLLPATKEINKNYQVVVTM
jgi:cellobiose phosphorylase